MIIAEDKSTHEIRKLVLIDAHVQLGNIRIGDQTRLFNPPRLLSYYAQVESQLHDYATRYPESFKFLPRRAYDYLTKPPLLSSLYQTTLNIQDTTWLSDQFVSTPLVDISSKALPKLQRVANTEATNRWSTQSTQGSRFYQLQDFRYENPGKKGWGCILRANELEQVWKGRNRNDLMNYIKLNLPVYVQIDEYHELDHLLKWLILLKEAGLDNPSIILSTDSHRVWGKQITKLLEIPNSKILTSGATISSLSTIISSLKTDSDQTSWSRRIIYASAYPETQRGDSLPEILSFLLSKNLDATSSDIQKILGGNILSMLPPRPPFLTHIDSTSAVVAEGRFGQIAFNELERIIRILSAMNIQNVVSFDFMIEDDGGVVRNDCAVITMSQPESISGSSIALIVENDDTLRVSGWKHAFSENVRGRNGSALTTLIRSASQSSGVVLNTPTHVSTLNKELLRSLRVENPQGILSSLHFQVQVETFEKGIVKLCEEDILALGLADNDQVLVMDVTTSQWWSARVRATTSCSSKTIVISQIDSLLYGANSSTYLDLISYTGEISELEKVILGYDLQNNADYGETAAFLYLNREDFIKQLHGRSIGKGSKLLLGKTGSEISTFLKHSKPKLDPGQIGLIDDTTIEFRPIPLLKEFNLILCLAIGSEMDIKDVQLSTEYSTKRILSPFIEKVPEIETFLTELDKTASRVDIAILSALLAIESISSNRTDGRLAVVTVSDSPEKFTIQKGEIVQPYITFDDDLTTDEVLVSLIYTLLDSKRSPGGITDLSEAFRAIAELLDDFGPEKPTLVVLLSNSTKDIDSKSEPFIRAISRRSRYELNILGMGTDFSDEKNNRLLDGVKSHIFPVEEFSSLKFQSYLISAIERICNPEKIKTD